MKIKSGTASDLCGKNKSNNMINVSENFFILPNKAILNIKLWMAE